MPEVGIEPTSPKGHASLSRARLPIPPLRLMKAKYNQSLAGGQARAKKYYKYKA